MALMGSGMAELAVHAINTKDDDLIYYTMMILVNLTKEPHHRNVFATEGLLPILYDLLTSSTQVLYENRPAEDDDEPKVKDPEADDDDDDATATIDTGSKEKILTQVCAVIGQFCKSHMYQEKFQSSERSQDGFPYTSMCLRYIFIHFVDEQEGFKQERVREWGRTLKLLAQVMFCMKQINGRDIRMKSKCGGDIIPPLVAALANPDAHPEAFQSPEFLYQALLLLVDLHRDCPDNHKRMGENVATALIGMRNFKCVNYIQGFRDKLDNFIDTLSQSTIPY
jgi:hypothetical protein